jgi:3-phosphoshikimate 1-carboxyvinyltransferase
MKILPKVRLRGRFEPPGDKSVGHRLALLAAIARGRSRLAGFAPGQDCASTVGLIEQLGVTTSRSGDVLEVEGRGGTGLKASERPLDAGNSGSTARMACGLLSGQPFESRIVGDESLSRRPFDRVVRPLTEMGGSFETTAGSLPLTIHGTSKLRGIDYELPVASAQVKTAVLLAGLFAEGTTSVRETTPSRNHTEIALAGFGAPPVVRGSEVRVEGGAQLRAGRFRLPGDFSSAAFFIGAAAFLPGSELVVENVGLNKTRTGLLDVLRAMGADIEVEPTPTPGAEEPVGVVVVRGRELHGTTVPAESIPALIDELPVLAVVAAFASGTTRIENASELRVKESDRLAAIVDGLSALGADVELIGARGASTTHDGFEVRGGRELRQARLRSFGDHRMVMAWAIAALGVDGECTIDHLDQVRISYPGFWQTLERLVR